MMKEDQSIAEINWISLTLIQAMLGAISNNFRMVAFSWERGVLKIRFTLEVENSVDREEIEDVCSEFEALQDRPIKYQCEVAVTDALIAWPEANWRVIFRRRES